MLNRDEKIENEIIKPKDDLIKELYKNNLSLHKELSKQLIKDFEKQTNTFIDPVKQLDCEEREKEWDLEL